MFKRTFSLTPTLRSTASRSYSQAMSSAFTPSSKSQPVIESLTTAALFLTMTLESPVNASKVKSVLAQVNELALATSVHDPKTSVLCVVGIGSEGWKKLFGDKLALPKGLHPFKELKGVHHAPSTPGDLFFHIRAEEMAICFELGAQIGRKLEGVAKVVDEVQAFKFNDNRNLLGFVDGTGNPEGQGILDATLVTQKDDPNFINGSYVITQKYLHDVKAWEALPLEMQERIIGRTKQTDKSLKEKKESWSHNVLTELKNPDGTQDEILRDNMPFGDIGKGEFGTFFIGYSKVPEVTEKMLDNMFIGDPVGNYDRILDYSTAVTGNLFFCPTKDFLNMAEQF